MKNKIYIAALLLLILALGFSITAEAAVLQYISITCNGGTDIVFKHLPAGDFVSGCNAEYLDDWVDGEITYSVFGTFDADEATHMFAVVDPQGNIASLYSIIDKG